MITRSNLLKLVTMLLLVILFSPGLFAQTIISDNFSSSSSNWQGVSIAGNGSFNVSGGTMNISANAGATYGVYNTQVLSGHFYMEVDFGQDDNVALALFKANTNGTVDTNNFSLIKVEDDNGVPVVSVSDRQNGNIDVLDNTGAADKNLRSSNRLDASTFSIPYTSTNKKLRILRHANENFLHFFYHVKKNVAGQDAIGWIELLPSKEWSQLNGNFYMGLVAIDGSATFDDAMAYNKPINDQNDANTGFAATWREMNWSGYFGDALVVTFDANDAPLTGGTRKFVFWEAFNNVPAWYLDDEVMYTYEFVETWDGGSLGAHEPMSDRLRRFSNVTLDYDGNDYKIIHWEYVLMDPDYKWPDFGQGTEIPMVDEWYKIYPDGTILRKIRYKPKLDTSFRNWHELTELIVISGNVTDPSEHLASPSLSIWPINDQQLDFDPTGQGNNYEQSNNDATILAVHMLNHPDLVNVFSDNAAYPDTYAGDPITYYKTWHDKFFHMSHWPINKELYHSDPFKSQTTWKEQVKHASIAGAGVYENNSSQWTANFQVDPADGREYREWISYMGLSPQGNLAYTKSAVESWRTDPWNWTGISTPPAPQTNVALNRPTTSSSVGGGNGSQNAVDGNENTRWESNHGSDPEWIYVDLGENHDISRVLINWEAAYSSSYRIETSADAMNWTTVHTDNNANGGVDDIALNNATGRYVRVFGTARATQWGHSLYELEVYGNVASSISYDIDATSGPNGTISPTGTTTLNEGSNQTFTITANSGYQISDVLVDNVSQGAIASYTFTNVTSNHSIAAQFTAIPSYTVTATAGTNGSITPAGSVSVLQGSDQSFTMTPDSGFEIDEVVVNGVSQGAISSYTFNNVTAAQNISVSFVAQTVPPIGRVEAEDYIAMSGIQTENTSDTGGGLNVGWIDAGDWMDYSINVGTAGDYMVDFRVAAQNDPSRFDLKVGNTVLTSVDEPSTGGWQNWTTVSKMVTLNAGPQTIRIEATGSWWNINWMEFTPVNSGGSSCNINWTAPNISVNQQTVNWSSGAIDISCASMVDISMDLEGAGPMENADYLNVYYRVDGGTLVAISENVNAFSLKTVTANGINGNSLELIVNGYTSWGNETYTVSNISVSSPQAGAREASDTNSDIPMIEELSNEITFYPNPTAGHQLNVAIPRGEPGELIIALLLLEGKMILTQKHAIEAGKSVATLDLDSVPDGIYLLRITANEKQLLVDKVIVSR